MYYSGGGLYSNTHEVHLQGYGGIPGWGDVGGSMPLAWHEKVHVWFGFACHCLSCNTVRMLIGDSCSLERGNGRLHCTSHVRLEDGVKTWYQSSTDYEPDTGVADSSYSLPQITRAGYGYAFAAVYDSKRGNYVSPRTSLQAVLPFPRGPLCRMPSMPDRRACPGEVSSDTGRVGPR
jgi:hypothetical protein